MKKILSFLVLSTIAISVQAKNCEVIPKNTFCGIPISSTPEQFFTAVGLPSSEIKLSTDRLAYLYIDKKKSIVTMLTFKNRALVEVRSWEVNPNIDFWGFLKQTEPLSITLLGEAIIGKQRKTITDKYLNIMVSEGSDQFGDTAALNGTEINFTYLPFYGPSSYSLSDMNAYEKYTCQSVVFSRLNDLPP